MADRSSYPRASRPILIGDPALLVATGVVTNFTGRSEPSHRFDPRWINRGPAHMGSQP